MTQRFLNSAALAAVIALPAVGHSAPAEKKAQASKEAKKMNLVFILTDDLGWNDVTINGCRKLYETPNLERLAARGTIFSRAYAASPLSSPTRASILTGQTPARTGITSPSCHNNEVEMKPYHSEKGPVDSKTTLCRSATRLDTAVPTMSQLIAGDGYATAHFGKWHLGKEPYTPLEHGFQVDIPHWWGPGPAGSYVAPWKFPQQINGNFKPRTEHEHIEERMSYEAVKWLRERDKTKPFYLNYWAFSVHAPFDARQDYIDSFRPKVNLGLDQRSPTYAAMVRSMDDAVGALLDEIDAQGIADNTIIIFFSDNGGNMYNGIREKTVDGGEYFTVATSNAALRGGKATVFEGGIRVPCVVVWPGVTKAGARSEARIQSTDFYPTLLGSMGIGWPAGHKIDGVDITPALKGEKFDRGPMFTFFPHNPNVPDWLPANITVHSGDWKLIRMFLMGEGTQDAYLLYDLKNDPEERYDLSKRNPAKLAELKTLTDNYLARTNPVIPTLNPVYDPQKAKPELIGVQPGGTRGIVQKIVPEKDPEESVQEAPAKAKAKPEKTK